MIKVLAKTLLAALMSIALLSLFLSLYTLFPINVENERGNTDYVWEPETWYFRTDEGIGWGRFDGNGFNNSSIIINPDVLVLGSSHMEGSNLLQKETATVVLNNILSGGALLIAFIMKE